MLHTILPVIGFVALCFVPLLILAFIFWLTEEPVEDETSI